MRETMKKPRWISAFEDDLFLRYHRDGLPPSVWFCWAQTPCDCSGTNISPRPTDALADGIVSDIEALRVRARRPPLDHVKFVNPDPAYKMVIMAHVSGRDYYASSVGWTDGFGFTLLDEPEEFVSVSIEKIRDAIRRYNEG